MYKEKSRGPLPHPEEKGGSIVGRSSGTVEGSHQEETSWSRRGHTRKPNMIVRGLYWVFDKLGDFTPMFRSLWGFVGKSSLVFVSFILLAGTIAMSAAHSLALLRYAGFKYGLEWVGVLVWETLFIFSFYVLERDYRKHGKSGWAPWAGFSLGLAFVEASNLIALWENIVGRIIGGVTPVLLLVNKGILAHLFRKEEPIEKKTSTGTSNMSTLDTERVDTNKLDMKRVDISNVDIKKVDMKVDTSKVDISKVDTEKVDMGQVDMKRVDISNMKPSQVDTERVDVPQVDKDMVDKKEVDTIKVSTSRVDIPEVDIKQVDIKKVDTSKVDRSNYNPKVDMDKLDTKGVDISRVDTKEVDMKRVDMSRSDSLDTNKVDIKKVDTKVLDISKFLENRKRKNNDTIKEIERVVQYCLEVQQQEGIVPGRKRLKTETGCNEYVAKEAKKILDKLTG